jgi:hypothetical protein
LVRFIVPSYQGVAADSLFGAEQGILRARTGKFRPEQGIHQAVHAHALVQLDGW